MLWYCMLKRSAGLSSAGLPSTYLPDARPVAARIRRRRLKVRIEVLENRRDHPLKSPLYNNKGQSAAMKALSTLNKQMGEIATLQLNSSDSDAQHSMRARVCCDKIIKGKPAKAVFAHVLT